MRVFFAPVAFEIGEELLLNILSGKPPKFGLRHPLRVGRVKVFSVSS